MSGATTPPTPEPSPSTGHYRGLEAELYDLWLGPGGAYPDEPYYCGKIEEAGGRALEIGCGTGRLLIPYLKAGLDVEGVDASPDMLDICRRNAEAAGVTPILHRQLMQQLDLAQRYRTVYIPASSFVLLERREEAFAALECFYRHLEPGGQLVMQLDSRGTRWI